MGTNSISKHTANDSPLCVVYRISWGSGRWGFCGLFSLFLLFSPLLDLFQHFSTHHHESTPLLLGCICSVPPVLFLSFTPAGLVFFGQTLVGKEGILHGIGTRVGSTFNGDLFAWGHYGGMDYLLACVCSSFFILLLRARDAATWDVSQTFFFFSLVFFAHYTLLPTYYRHTYLHNMEYGAFRFIFLNTRNELCFWKLQIIYLSPLCFFFLSFSFPIIFFACWVGGHCVVCMFPRYLNPSPSLS
ncbi:hypothetical protein DM02DRAFT_104991 [Periconia macrospinosa]|uniref:Uncharacterized protein n=1 Tax=Periconia macrospinosa TaxID=97972 RepID=A0A2V1DFB3_9PLEO|nr:hypothetical protein DM02DRAFT_104991 [Periconia macrospinosa]